MLHHVGIQFISHRCVRHVLVQCLYLKLATDPKIACMRGPASKVSAVWPASKMQAYLCDECVSVQTSREELVIVV